MKFKLKIFLKILAVSKKSFDFSNYSTISKYYDLSNKLVIGKMKNETTGNAIKGYIELKLQIQSFLVDDNSEHKKVKYVNRKS